MRINQDCIRDILLYIENLTLSEMQHGIESEELSEVEMLTEKYSKDDIVYSLIQLIDAGYLEGETYEYVYDPTSVRVDKITWEGHEFIDATRSETVWLKTKEKVSKLIGETSLAVLTQVATAVSKQLLGL
ncbi:DUF2513 domain-containing protein [Listeria booriae]|uniref:DUF2513 domain-containing protein n=1 Tax=Listeria booriae TaxID=1552123 RepID=UPI001629721A|nr:DUF2513 domain-containing protein [Listeria booriae]MBC1525469.1 DUF2513 domain-containing protein [Listeria booriae]